MKKVTQFGKQFLEHFNRHDLMTLSAALAFYTALSLAPLLLISIAVLGWLGHQSVDELIAQIRVVIGAQASEAVALVASNAKERQDLSNLSGIIGAIVLVFSASGVFAQLQSSLNLIWDVDTNKNSGKFTWIKRRLASMGIVLSLGFLSIVSLGFSAVLSSFLSSTGALWEIVNALVALAAFSVLFAAIYKVLPDRPIGWTRALRGGAVTAILFTIGKLLIGIYLGNGAVGSSYGASGSLLVFLVWVYYSSLILFVGAEITALLDGNADRPNVPGTEGAQLDPQLAKANTPAGTIPSRRAEQS